MSRLGNRVTVRSYRGVVDSIERRIYRFDRWRLPTPHGLSVRALVYAIVTFIAVLLVGSLPLVGQLFELLPASIRWIVVPIGAGWLLASWAPDGRAPHHALVSAARYLLAAKHLAGLRRCPAIGAELLAGAEIQVAPSGDEPCFRAGVVKGPAKVTIRYPAVVTAERLPHGVCGAASEIAPQAKRLRVRGVDSSTRPLARAKTISVPAGKEMRFE